MQIEISPGNRRVPQDKWRNRMLAHEKNSRLASHFFMSPVREHCLSSPVSETIFGVVQRDCTTQQKIRRSIMKTILSAIVALSVLTGVAASANAFDAKSFYEQLDRQSGN